MSGIQGRLCYTYPFNDKLSDAISFVDSKILVTQVKKKNLNLATIVCVNDAGTGGDAVLHCEPRARSNAAICSCGSTILLESEHNTKVVDLQVSAGTAIEISVSTKP